MGATEDAELETTSPLAPRAWPAPGALQQQSTPAPWQSLVAASGGSTQGMAFTVVPSAKRVVTYSEPHDVPVWLHSVPARAPQLHPPVGALFHLTGTWAIITGACLIVTCRGGSTRHPCQEAAWAAADTH
jgi:hypothetical protein